MRTLRRALWILVATTCLPGIVAAQPRPLVFGILNQQSPALTAERWNPILHYLTSVSGSETILLAEDEDGVRELARDILRSHGYCVLEASDPDEAIAVCRRHAGSIDLLLTDVVMPRASGPELADRLRAVWPALKVLYMSGYTDRAIVHHGVLDPDVAFLEKPFTAANLRRKVREVLDTT